MTRSGLYGGLLLVCVGCADPIEGTPAESPAAGAATAEAEAPEGHAAPEADDPPPPVVVPAAVAAGREPGEPLPENEADEEAAPDEPAGGVPEIHNDVIAGFEIRRFALARNIVDREPVGITNRFVHDSGPLHVFIDARNRTGEDVEIRVGFHRVEEPRRGSGVRLNVPSMFRYRTRARATTRRRPGEWICTVTDDRGRVLVAQRFHILPAEDAE